MSKLICFISLLFIGSNAFTAEYEFPSGSIISKDKTWAIRINSAEGDIQSYSYYEETKEKQDFRLSGSFGQYSGFRVEVDSDYIKVYAPGTVKADDGKHIKGIYLIEISKGGKKQVKLQSNFSQFIEFAKEIQVSKIEPGISDLSVENWLHTVIGNSSRYIYEWEVEHCELKDINPVCVQLHIRYKDRAKAIPGYDIILNLDVGDFKNGTEEVPKVWSLTASKVKNYKWYDKQTPKTFSELESYIKN